MNCPYCNKAIGKAKTWLEINGERVYIHPKCKSDAARDWVIVKRCYTEVRRERDATQNNSGSKGGT